MFLIIFKNKVMQPKTWQSVKIHLSLKLSYDLYEIPPVSSIFSGLYNNTTSFVEPEGEKSNFKTTKTSSS